MKRIYCNGIHALSSGIAMLIQENEYTEDDQILLTYGVEIWMEEIVKTGALLLGGLLIGRIKEIAVAILSFCSMRKVAGGYPAFVYEVPKPDNYDELIKRVKENHPELNQ